MNKRAIVVELMLFSLLCAISVAAPAQPAKSSSASQRQASGAASRNQFATCLADFQKHPDDSTLRKQVVELARSMNPAPPVSALARDSFARATARMKNASTTDDFLAAAKLFEQAAEQAPWYAEADSNAATARARGADFEGARRDLNFYLAAARPGANPHIAEELRRDIDSQQATQQFQEALRQFAANPDLTARLHIIRLAQAMKTLPEIPENAREHYVMASVLAGSAEDNPAYAKRAVNEYNAALLAAPWWGDVYRKLATLQTTLQQFDDAIASLSCYLLIQPADARRTQDEIYRLKALGQKAADDQALKQAEEQQRKLKMQRTQEQRAAVTEDNLTIDGQWYAIPTPNSYFAGGKSDPGCDYVIKQNDRRWTITNACARHQWTIEDVEVQARYVTFRILGHDSAVPFGEVSVAFTLSNDGQTLEGQANAYDKAFNTIGSHPARWARR
jgi:hypothetical protein